MPMRKGASRAATSADDAAFAATEERNEALDLRVLARECHELPDGFLDKVRAAKGSKLIQAKYKTAWEANSFVADPRFTAFEAAAPAKNDYRLRKDSPAIGKGVVLPKDLTDPQRPDSARPDIGAFPLGIEEFDVGRHGRLKSPFAGKGSP